MKRAFFCLKIILVFVGALSASLAAAQLSADMTPLKIVNVTEKADDGKIQKISSGTFDYKLKDGTTRPAEIRKETVILDPSGRKISVSDLKVGHHIQLHYRVNEWGTPGGKHVYTFDAVRVDVLPGSSAK
jgi:hypothetical protein